MTFIQRFGSSLNLHFHYHTVVMDELFYTDEEGRLTHIPVDNLGVEDCAAIAEAVRDRVIKLFERVGLLSSEQVDVMKSWQHSGFSVNADVSLEPTNRAGLKRWIRYCVRPVFADKQWSIQNNGIVKFELSKPSVKGETGLLLTSFELLDKLARIEAFWGISIA